MTAAEAASNSAYFSVFGGVSVLLCGWLSDRLGSGARAAMICGGLALSTLALLTLGFGWMPAAQVWPVILVAVVAFLTIGPYSFLAGAISLDFGGKQGAATASGIIDAVGYLGAMLSGDTMARVSITYGWGGAFLLLAGIAFLSSATAAAFLVRERKARA